LEGASAPYLATYYLNPGFYPTFPGLQIGAPIVWFLRGRGARIDSKLNEVLAGLVDRVTFHNSENGFWVLRVKARGQRDLITVIGHATMISAGKFVQANGNWINDSYPWCPVQSLVSQDDDDRGIENIWIRDDPGIGPFYARKLVCLWGELVYKVTNRLSISVQEVKCNMASEVLRLCS
jgi:exodeoxyribonuclease V alpha subunit